MRAIVITAEGTTHFSIEVNADTRTTEPVNVISLQKAGGRLVLRNGERVILDVIPAEVVTPESAEVLASGQVALDTGASGRINSIKVNSVEQLSSNEILAVGQVDLTGGPAVAADGTITFATGIVDNTVTVNGLVYTAVAGSKAGDFTKFSIDTSNTATAADLADSINNDVRTGTLDDVSADASVAVVTVTSTELGTGGNATTLAENTSSTTITISGATFTGGLNSSIDGILVNSIEIMDGAESYVDSFANLAILVAANITGNPSAPNYSAVAVDDDIIISASPGSGYAPNGFTVISDSTTATTSDADMAGGVAANSIPFNTSLAQTAIDAAANITANVLQPNFTAAAVGDDINIKAVAGSGNTPNGFVVLSNVTTITTTDTNMSGGKTLMDVLTPLIEVIIYES